MSKKVTTCKSGIAPWIRNFTDPRAHFSSW